MLFTSFSLYTSLTEKLHQKRKSPFFKLTQKLLQFWKGFLEHMLYQAEVIKTRTTPPSPPAKPPPICKVEKLHKRQ